MSTEQIIFAITVVYGILMTVISVAMRSKLLEVLGKLRDLIDVADDATKPASQGGQTITNEEWTAIITEGREFIASILSLWYVVKAEVPPTQMKKRK